MVVEKEMVAEVVEVISTARKRIRAVVVDDSDCVDHHLRCHVDDDVVALQLLKTNKLRETL
jgi:hypothetical protein